MRLSIYGGNGVVADNPGPLRLILAPTQHAQVGTPIRYYWYGLSLAEDYDGIEFRHDGPGTSHADRWEWTPTTPGTFKLVLRDSLGGRVSQRIIVHPDAGAGEITTCIVGDSNTAAGGATAWPARLHTALVADGVDVTMLGTQQGNPDPQPGVYHEGFPGRTYQWMVDGTPPDTDVPPFRHSGVLDVAHYDATVGTPSVILVSLGTNDYGNSRLGEFLDADTAEDMAFARTLIDAFRAQWPTIPICLGLTLPLQMSGGIDTRTKRHRWLEMYLEEFGDDENLIWINTHASVSNDNFVNAPHPSSTGHGEIHDMTYPTVRYLAGLAA